MTRLQQILLYTCVLAWCGCDTRADTVNDTSRTQSRVVALAEVLTAGQIITPEQNDTTTVARISGLDFDDSGRFLIADVSEADVKVFAPNGSLIARLGRKGAGPGEFMSPRFARFVDGNSVVVADAELMRLTWWDVTTKSVTKTLTLSGISTMMGFELVNDTTALISMTSGQNENVLTFIDLQSGQPGTSFLPIGGIAPPELRGHLWFHLTSRRDTAYVVATLSDSLWKVHLPSLRVSSSGITPVGYIPPRAPERPFTGVAEMMAWGKQFHTAAPPVAVDAFVAVPFVQGVLNYGDPMLLSVLTHDAAITVRGAPPVISSMDNLLVTLPDPMADTVSFQTLTWK